jgi:cation:H+ antiporter
MLGWLVVLAVASFFVSLGAERLASFYGAKFIGRTVLSIATTIPEIAIVLVAAVIGSFDVALGSALGSNLLMMTLGLAIMLLIATTRLSRAPLKQIDVKEFKLDQVLLVVSAAAAAILFINGYKFIDGLVLFGIFVVYILLTFREMRIERRSNSKKETPVPTGVIPPGPSLDPKEPPKSNRGRVGGTLALLVGAAGIAAAAQPFIVSLKQFSVEIGVPAVILAVLISPIAGEMPEKLSMMMLARRGAVGASIAVANVLGSKILNNTLLFALAIFGNAVFHGGLAGTIPPETLLWDQMVLVTFITFAAVLPFFRKKLTLSTGVFLFLLYLVGVLFQFVLV